MSLHCSSAPASKRFRPRDHEIEAGRLVLRVAAGAGMADAGATPAAAFLWRRAVAAVSALGEGPARYTLGRVLDVLEHGAGADEVTRALVCWGGVLERHRVLGAAAEVYEAAFALAPRDAELALHAARARRLMGERAAAAAHYARVRVLAGAGPLSSHARLGEALLEEDPVAALGDVVAGAVETGEREVAAVALEERARLKRRDGSPDAVADYMEAALLYTEASDRVRVAHALADLLLAKHDAAGAREALVAGLDVCLPAHRPHVVSRLRSVARAQGDQLGLRRWPSAGPSQLVSLAPVRAAGPARPSSAPLLREWRDRLTAV
jgi:hypothetical protein